MDFDFGYSPNETAVADGDNNGNNGGDITNLETGKVTRTETVEPGNEMDKLDDVQEKPTEKVDDDTKDNKDTKLVAGTSIEVGDETYTIDDKGNVIDKNGNIYKEASEVQNWLDSFESVDDSTNELSISTIQEMVGVEITDDNDKPIQFDNTPEGIKSYLDAVIETAKEEHYETAINTLYQKYPIIPEVLNYYIANGNSLEGFGEVPDRSNIVVEEDNEAQQEAIVRLAWRERNQRGDVNSYIEYLKSAGSLYATAVDELSAIQESDKAYREDLKAKAEAIEMQRVEEMKNYWNGVYETINSRRIAGYEIPESIIVNRNGQKISVTPNDFFNYLYRVDNEGKSAYVRDLENETPESRREDEILRAYLKFVGGNYSNLVNMAINKEQVAKLKLKAKERNNTSVRISKPKGATAKGAAIDLGYN